MCGDGEVANPPPVVGEHDQGEQNAEAGGGDVDAELQELSVG